MIDGLGRKIDYIRISITDRCNLRCIYCMPEEGCSLAGSEEILTDEEILRLVELFAKVGISKIKLTGGEPLLRKNCALLAERLKQISGIEQVTLTTNGVLLKGCSERLEQVGLDGINVSLDTLNPEVYKRITGRDELADVMEGIRCILDGGIIPLKINCVPMGMEEQKPEELAEIARQFPIHVRFIEMMPIGYGKQFSSLPEDSLRSCLEKKYGKAIPCKVRLGNGPSHYYEFPDFCGKIGFISAVSHKFCSDCNRLRLTSEGYLKTCLQYEDGADLRKLLRQGISDGEILDIIRKTILKKPEGHCFFQKKRGKLEGHRMSEIGG